MSAYAIVETGGKQYRVEPGKSIVVEKLHGDEGSTIELDRVLLVPDDSSTTIGTPLVDGAKVLAEVEKQAKGDKIIVFKYKPKVRYSVKNGHRQQLTKLAIKEILTGGQKAAASKKAVAPKTTAAPKKAAAPRRAAARTAPAAAATVEKAPAAPRRRKKADDGA